MLPVNVRIIKRMFFIFFSFKVAYIYMFQLWRSTVNNVSICWSITASEIIV